MEVVIAPDTGTLGILAADTIVALLSRKPDAVLGLATGSSPLVVYDELIARHQAVHHLVEGSVSAMWPATILQHHPHVTVLLDDAAARRLQLSDYYREAYRSKPDWQGI